LSLHRGGINETEAIVVPLFVLLGGKSHCFFPSPVSFAPAAISLDLSYSPNKQISQARLLSGYGKLPLNFEENQGQTDARVKFLAREVATPFPVDDQTPLCASWRVSDPAGSFTVRALLHQRCTRKYSYATVRLSLARANPHAPIEGNDSPARPQQLLHWQHPSRWQHTSPFCAR